MCTALLGARIAGAMDFDVTKLLGISMVAVGQFAGARGACPVCGDDVQRTHAFNGARLADRYACMHCGPTVYTVPVLA